MREFLEETLKNIEGQELTLVRRGSPYIFIMTRLLTWKTWRRTM